MKLKIGTCTIRNWRADDAPSLVRYADNKKIWIHLRDAFPHPYSLTDAERFLAMAARQDPKTFFAIADDTEAIGGIGLNLGEDVHRFSAEIGYWLAEPFWNKGIMSRAVRRFTDYSFEAFTLNRVFAEPYVGNSASVRVLEKAGFVYEGRMRASVFKDGNVLDQFLFAKIKNECP